MHCLAGSKVRQQYERVSAVYSLRNKVPPCTREYALLRSALQASLCEIVANCCNRSQWLTYNIAGAHVRALQQRQGVYGL